MCRSERRISRHEAGTELRLTAAMDAMAGPFMSLETRTDVDRFLILQVNLTEIYSVISPSARSLAVIALNTMKFIKAP